MKKNIEIEFQSFLVQLFKSIGLRLSSRFQENAVDDICAGLSNEGFRLVLADVVRTLRAARYNVQENNEYNEVISILLIHMIGPLNRMSLPESVERRKLLYAYLSVLDQALQHVELRRAFTNILEQGLKAA